MMIRVVLAAALPPIVSVALSYSVLITTEYEKRCFETLDLDTPGLVCAPDLGLLLDSILVPAFHLAVALPAAWYISRAFRPATRTASLTFAALIGLDLLVVAYYAVTRTLPPGGEAIIVLIPIAVCPALALIVLRAGGAADAFQQGAAADER